MQNILSQLPNPNDLNKIVDGKFDLNTIGLDPKTLGDLKDDMGAGDLKDNILNAVPSDLALDLSSLSADGAPGPSDLTAGLSAPLDNLKGFSSDSLKNTMIASIPTPSFEGAIPDLNSLMGDITSKIMPGTSSPLTNVGSAPGLDFVDLSAPFQKLASTGGAAPVRLLNMVLSILRSFVDTISDPTKLLAISRDAVQDVYAGHIRNLQQALPVSALQQMEKILKGSVGEQSLLQKYAVFLSQLEKLDAVAPDHAKITEIRAQAENTIIRDLQIVTSAKNTLNNLKTGDLQSLNNMADAVKDVTGEGTALLQPYFDQVDATLGLALEKIAQPVEKFTAMAGKLEDLMQQGADQATGAVQVVSQKTTESIGNVTDLLNTVQQNIEEIELKITEFLNKLDVTPAISKVKEGCGRASEGIESVVEKVETAKLKLDDAVKMIQGRVDGEMTAALNQVEKEIRALLGQITGILERPEVKQTLAQAKQGVDTIKTKLETVTLDPVFNLVVAKTAELETSIKGVDVSMLSSPAKMALQGGLKIIEQVAVDEKIKPELLALFRELRAPVQEVVRLLEEKILVIERMVDEFNPGSVVNGLIVNSEPYKLVFDALESVKPSELLKPLKEANAALTNVVEQINPDLLINELQKIFNRISALTDALSPTSLNVLIQDSTGLVTAEMERIRDYELDEIAKLIKDTVSLEKLLTATGISDIARADFWKTIHDILGGAILNEISGAMNAVEEKIAVESRNLDFSILTDAIAALSESLDVDLAGDIATKFQDGTTSLVSFYEDAATKTKIDELRIRVQTLQSRFPESEQKLLGEFLTAIDVTPLLDFQTALKATAGGGQLDNLTAVQNVLTTLKTELEAISTESFRELAPVFFKNQFSVPVRGLIVSIQAKLEPFQEAAAAVQNILLKLEEITRQLDTTLDSAVDLLKKDVANMLSEAIETLETFSTSITEIITTVYNRVRNSVDAFSPYQLLNSVSESGDFTNDASGAGNAPAGLIRFGDRLRNVAQITEPLEKSICTKLYALFTPEQLALLKAETAGSLSIGNRKNVTSAINALLKRDDLAEDFLNLKQKLETELQKLNSELFPETAADGTNDPEQQVAKIKQLYRNAALLEQLLRTKSMYAKDTSDKNLLVRFNRLILEAAFPLDINLSVQTLHPFIVEMTAHLYPEKTVQRFDAIYANVVDKFKQLPQQMIQRPLDDEFNKIKTILDENFDISGVFSALNLFLDGLDSQLENGLDKISISYRRLLAAGDRKLSES